MREQWIAYTTIVRREVMRFVRIWPQTLMPPVITQTLYFVIFGNFIGSRIGEVQGLDYVAFIVPGLIMMAVINSAYSNVVSSFFSSKFQRNIEEMMVAPMSEWVMIGGYVTGGALRGLMVGVLVFTVSVLFTRPQISHLSVIAAFALCTAVVFALGGMTNGIFARKFDDVSIFPTFILTPLTYLGGVFYSIQSLPPFWQKVSRLNPILYMVNGFRYGFYGRADVDVTASLLMLLGFIVALAVLNAVLIRRGVGLRT